MAVVEQLGEPKKGDTLAATVKFQQAEAEAKRKARADVLAAHKLPPAALEGLLAEGGREGWGK